MENSRIKQRIVGGIILVSLAVIVLPMIFSKSGEREISGSNIPQKPDYLVKTEIIPLEIKKLPDPENTVQRRVVQEDTKTDPVKEDPIKPAMVESDIVKEEPVTTPEESKVKVAYQADKKALVSGWVVQVGSFSSQSNAIALRDKLRGNGYSSFVESVKGSKVVYRVRVGPEIKEEQAQALKNSLNTKMKLDGLVMRHR